MGEGPIDLNASFEVVDESEQWIVVNKSAPLVVHPTSGKSEATLLGGVEELLRYELVNGARLSIINRLDRETSGVVLIAKAKSAARLFGRAMERRQIQKEYLAIVHGWPEWHEHELNAPIIRKGEVEESLIWVKQMVHEEGRECVTVCRVVRKFEKNGQAFSLMRIFPKTGRMHQIRVHLAYLGFPIVGDKIYGDDESCYLEFIEGGWSERLRSQLLLGRHALHAERMVVSTEQGVLDWRAPLAGDLRCFLEC
ncbi:RluA family pseudouridine synthase [Rubritalea spongiae]|uniref:RluA family pseudouridine synthase n=1 Tax=Rubritalea spongiae TaxID=430797 RepID=A0ABW5E644_9BACT